MWNRDGVAGEKEQKADREPRTAVRHALNGFRDRREAIHGGYVGDVLSPTFPEAIESAPPAGA